MREIASQLDEDIVGATECLRINPDDETRCGTAFGEQEHEESASSLYQPLPSASHFRLLRLLAGVDGIHCCLYTFSFDPEAYPPYRAISYEWGPQDAQEEVIYLRSEAAADYVPTYLKSRNLHQLLKQFRSPKHDRWVWIDALCINQDSMDERSQQVRLMGRIFEQANIVSAWLGTTDTSKSDGKTLAALIQPWKEQYSRPDLPVLELLRAIDYSLGKRLPLLDVCNLSYWRRKWIVQELLLARTVVCHYGGIQWPMQVFEDICAFAIPHGTLEPSNQRREWLRLLPDTPITRLALHRRDPSLAPRTLKKFLVAYETTICKETCDHIYALYSLIGEHRHHLDIDYDRKPVEHAQAAIEFMHRYEDLHLETMRVAGLLGAILGLRVTTSGSAMSTADPDPASMLKAAFFEFKTLETKLESATSESLRSQVDPLPAIPQWRITRRHDLWEVVETPSTSVHPSALTVSPCDMVYFHAPRTSIHGLASSHIGKNDGLWIFQEARLALIVRVDEKDTVVVKGRAVLFKPPARYYGDDLNESTGVGGTARDTPSAPDEHILQHSMSLSFDQLMNMARWTSSYT